MSGQFCSERPFGGSGVQVSVVMGSRSDFEPCMRFACETLVEFRIPFEVGIVSAHRTPERLHKYATDLAFRDIKLVIAGAGGAAHLAGTIAALTTVPVIGVPVKSSTLSGIDSLYSTVQMPAGVPASTQAIGKPGAINAALAAVSILAISDKEIRARYHQFRQQQTHDVPETAYD